MPSPYESTLSAAAETPNLSGAVISANSLTRTMATGTSKNKGARWIWRHADAVCFDVDSTVCQDEAIDELADFCGVGQQVAEMTKVAMNGNVTFKEALAARLDLIRPSRQTLHSFIQQNPPRLTPGIVELVNALHKRHVPVYLVTGGFRAIIQPVAKHLGIPDSHIFANVLLFNADGSYAGFDASQLTSDSGGKALVCKYLKEKYGYERLVMVGDGATDLETCPPADTFIGFGGNVVRQSVLERAEWFVRHFDELRLAMNANHHHN